MPLNTIFNGSGFDEAITDVEKQKSLLRKLVFNTDIKASGGGKGMRVVESEADFESQMDRAISEAIAALEMVLFYRKICGFA
jgi:propionyl-CoA carboxylase alpha chain